MAEIIEDKTESDFSKVPKSWPIVVAVAMFGAAVWGGGEIARGEIAQRQLDSITAKGRLVKAKVSLPSGAVVTAKVVEEVPTYANRVEPYCFNKSASVIGKKTKFGFEAGQVLTVKDLE
jgi:flagella basal body P-ring formation protein FlgA